MSPIHSSRLEAVSLELLQELAETHATVDEVAGLFAVPVEFIKEILSESYVDPRYREAWAKGRAMSNIALRKLQWAHANTPGSAGVSMARHLSEHWLGEGASEKNMDMAPPVNVQINFVKPEEIEDDKVITIEDFGVEDEKPAENEVLTLESFGVMENDGTG